MNDCETPFFAPPVRQGNGGLTVGPFPMRQTVSVSEVVRKGQVDAARSRRGAEIIRTRKRKPRVRQATLL